MGFESAPKFEDEPKIFTWEQLLELGLVVCDLKGDYNYKYPVYRPGSSEKEAYNMKRNLFIKVRKLEDVQVDEEYDKAHNIHIDLRSQKQLREMGVKVREYDRSEFYQYPCSEEGKAFNMKSKQFVDVEEIDVEGSEEV